MRQLVFIHGGETFDSYEDYLAALRSWSYDPLKETQKRWKNHLTEELGEGWEVFTPTMPSKYNAKYVEWCIWFEKVLPYLRDGAILVGHSLGGIFLAKYLNEHKPSIRIAATFLIAAPFDTRDTDYSLGDFVRHKSLEGLEQVAGRLYLYHSKDDPVVPFAAFEKYRALLPEAEVHIFSDRGHFLEAEFPELIEELKKLENG